MAGVKQPKTIRLKAGVVAAGKRALTELRAAEDAKDAALAAARAATRAALADGNGPVQGVAATGSDPSPRTRRNLTAAGTTASIQREEAPPLQSTLDLSNTRSREASMIPRPQTVAQLGQPSKGAWTSRRLNNASSRMLNAAGATDSAPLAPSLQRFATALPTGKRARASGDLQPDPPAKQQRLSSLQPCANGSSAPAAEVATIDSLVASGDINKMTPKEVMSDMVLEASRAAYMKMVTMMPQPTPHYLSVMKSRLQCFYLKTEMLLHCYHGPRERSPPFSTYAVAALQEASQSLDKGIEELELLDKLLDDASDTEKLLSRMGLGMSDVHVHRSTAAASQKKGLKAHQASAAKAKKKALPAEDVFGVLDQAFGIFRVRIESSKALVDMSKALIQDAEAILPSLPKQKPSSTPSKAINPTPLTPHTMMSGLEMAVNEKM